MPPTAGFGVVPGGHVVGPDTAGPPSAPGVLVAPAAGTHGVVVEGAMILGVVPTIGEPTPGVLMELPGVTGATGAAGLAGAAGLMTGELGAGLVCASAGTAALTDAVTVMAMRVCLGRGARRRR